MNIGDNNTTEKTNEKLQNNNIRTEYANQENYDSAIKEYSENLDKLIELANDSNEWRELKRKFADFREKLKSLFFNDEDNNIFIDKINNALDNINKKQNEEKELFELKSQNNYDSIIDVVKNAFEFATNNSDYKMAREKLLEAQESFKNLILKRSHRDELHKFIQNGYNIVSQKQSEERENYEMECIDNYHILKNKIDEVIEFVNINKIFTESRKALINIQNQIKDLKLKREQRDELFKVIRNTFDDVNKRQDEERKNYETEIVENYNATKTFVDEAINFANTSEDYSNSRERLIEAQNFIKSKKLKKEQRDELYADIRAVFEELNKKQSDERDSYENESNQNYQKLTDKVNDCFALVLGLTEFNIIRESLITVQGEVKVAKLKREQRNELFSRIREAFSVFDQKKNEYYANLKESKINKLNNIKSNYEEKIKRLQDVLVKDNEALELQKVKLNDSSADEFLINEINNVIQNIENRIKEKNETIEQTQEKIAKINEEIANL